MNIKKATMNGKYNFRIRLVKRLKSMSESMQQKYRRFYARRHEIMKIKNKEKMWGPIQLTPEQQELIKVTWGKYHVDGRWHRYYQSFTGNFDKDYMPESLFSSILEPKLVPRNIAKRLEDKAYLPIIFGGVKGLHIPKTVIANCSGLFYDGEYNIISKKDALQIIKNYLDAKGSAIIKPTLDSCSGRDVRIIDDVSLIEDYTENWIVQERILCQSDIRRLNENSVNTFRVITYYANEQIKIAPIIMRMGVGGSYVDNAHAGGIFIGVKNDGSFCKEAYSEYGMKCSEHPTSHVLFDGYKIDGFDRVLKAAIQCHKRTPHIQMCSWDFTIDDKGMPTLIELNLCGQTIWLSQIAHGKGIWGDDTEYMKYKLDE